MARKSMSKRIRFEVFKRDGFTCQYCGRKAPDVVLQVDHVIPVSKGGADELMNYITACVACNLGKGPRELGDESVLKKQQEQLEELNQKREQLRMMIKWRDGLRNLEKEKVQTIADAVNAATPRWVLNDKGFRTVEGWLREFPLDVILDAIEVSKCKLVTGEDGQLSSATCEDFYAYVPRVAKCRLQERKEPGITELFKVRGYLRTFLDFREWECLDLLRQCRDAGLSPEDMKRASSGVRYWNEYVCNLRTMAGL